MGTRKDTATWRVVWHWGRFAREAVESPSLEVLKSRLGEHLAGLVQIRAGLLKQGWD